ncbi:MAG: PLP-dependent aminotransferase family protein [Rhodobacteraceae bacterium]|nr:PLP-dependent aminotransferase family protein [Paracoccaceae bacterium]
MPISETQFILDPAARGTLQRQIQTMVATGILAGRFRPGDRLPSSRRLAQHLGVSRITVTLAYTELVSSDYLSARGRSGYFVSDTAPGPPALRPQAVPAPSSIDWGARIGTRFSDADRLEKPADWRDFSYPFIYGQADPDLFDHSNWRLCAVQALGQSAFDALTSDQYDRDDPELVEFIARHSLPRRGILARPDEILVTMGAQNALWLAAQVLLGQGGKAVMEDPGYPGLREILGQCAGKMVTVQVDSGGLPPQSIARGTDVIFTTPSHQCPTAATMPVARRRALLARAAEIGAVIVEDDYEFETSFLSAPSPALRALDRDGRVIYVGSFSKALFPGLRLGYLVGPAPVIREARALRATVLRHPPGHLQRTAAQFLSLGHYDAQLRRMSTVLRRRRAVMEQAIARHGLTIAGRDSLGGSSLWMTAPEGCDTAELAARLRSDGVLIEPGKVFFAGPERPRHFYRLAYSSIPEQRIEPGIARIAKALSETAAPG